MLALAGKLHPYWLALTLLEGPILSLKEKMLATITSCVACELQKGQACEGVATGTRIVVIMRITNHFLIGFQACSKRWKPAWYS